MQKNVSMQDVHCSIIMVSRNTNTRMSKNQDSWTNYDMLT